FGASAERPPSSGSHHAPCWEYSNTPTMIAVTMMPNPISLPIVLFCLRPLTLNCPGHSGEALRILVALLLTGLAAPAAAAVQHSVTVTATAYNALPEQTDGDPNRGAW